MEILPISIISIAGDAQNPVSYHTHNGIDSPLLGPNGGLNDLNITGGSAYITGSTTTTNANVKQVLLSSSLTDILVLSWVTVTGGSTFQKQGFVRTARFSIDAVPGGTGLTIMSQVQDSFTMRSASGFTFTTDLYAPPYAGNTTTFIRFKGATGESLTWYYSVLIFPLT